MQQGEIWVVDLPATGGREQGGQRPAVILQNEAYARNSPLVLIAPLTSQLAALRFPATMQVVPSTKNGLTMLSVIMVFQARAIDRRRFVRRLGMLDATDLSEMMAAVGRLIGRNG